MDFSGQGGGCEEAAQNRKGGKSLLLIPLPWKQGRKCLLSSVLQLIEAVYPVFYLFRYVTGRCYDKYLPRGLCLHLSLI